MKQHAKRCMPRRPNKYALHELAVLSFLSAYLKTPIKMRNGCEP